MVWEEREGIYLLFFRNGYNHVLCESIGFGQCCGGDGWGERGAVISN